MSNTLNQSPGFSSFTSKFKRLLTKEDPSNPPPKEMKLGTSGMQRYDKEKKKWVFEGDEPHKEDEFVPPPMGFVKKQSEISNKEIPVKRQMYVNIFDDNMRDQNYRPANIEENFNENLKNNEKKIVKDEDTQEKMKKDEDTEENMKKIILTDNQTIFTSEKLNKHKEKIRKLKENKKILIEHIKKIESYHECFNQDILQFNFSNENPVIDISLLSELEYSKQTIMKHEFDLFLKTQNFLLKNAKYKDLKLLYKEKLKETETKSSEIQAFKEILLQTAEKEKVFAEEKSFYIQTVEELKKNLNEKDFQIKNLMNSCLDYENDANTNKKTISELNTKITQLLNHQSQLEISLFSSEIQINELKSLNKSNSQKFFDLQIKNFLQEDNFQLLKKNPQEINKDKKFEGNELVLFKNKINNLELMIKDFEIQSQVQSSLHKSLEISLEDNKKLIDYYENKIESEKILFENKLEDIFNELSYEKLQTEQLKSEISLYKAEIIEKDEKFVRKQKEFGDQIKEIQEINKNWANEAKIFKEKYECLSEENNKKIEFLISQVEELEKENQGFRDKSYDVLEITDRYKSKYKNLKIDCKSMNELMKSQENDLNSKDFEIKKMTFKTLELNFKLEQQEKMIKDLENEIVLSKNKEESLKNELNYLEKEIKICERNMEEYKNNEKEIKTKEFQTLFDQIEEFQAKIIELTENNEGLVIENKKISGYQSEITNLKLELERLIEINSLKTAEIKELSEKLEFLTDKNNTSTEEIENLSVLNIKLKELLETSSSEIQKISDEHKNIKFELETQSSLNEQLEKSIQQKTYENYELLKEIDIINLELQEEKKNQFSLIINHEQKVSKLLEESNKALESKDFQFQCMKKRKNEKLEDLANESAKIKKTLAMVEQQVADYKNLLNSKDDELEGLKTAAETKKNTENIENQIKIDQSEQNTQDLSKLKQEIKYQQEKISQLNKEISELNSDIENYCEKILIMEQKTKNSSNKFESVLNEKNSEISKLGQRLKEKDEELELSKALYQQIMANNPDFTNIHKTDLIEENKSNEESNSDTFVIENINISQNNGWISSILSAVFLTDSERKN